MYEVDFYGRHDVGLDVAILDAILSWEKCAPTTFLLFSFLTLVNLGALTRPVQRQIRTRTLFSSISLSCNPGLPLCLSVSVSVCLSLSLSLSLSVSVMDGQHAC